MEVSEGGDRIGEVWSAGVVKEKKSKRVSKTKKKSSTKRRH